MLDCANQAWRTRQTSPHGYKVWSQSMVAKYGCKAVIRGIRMLTQISSPPQSPAPSGPVEMLLDCHHRIRHFVQLSRALAEAQESPQAQVAEAAEAIFRYFSQSLPLHEADENETLY